MCVRVYNIYKNHLLLKNMSTCEVVRVCWIPVLWRRQVPDISESFSKMALGSRPKWKSLAITFKCNKLCTANAKKNSFSFWVPVSNKAGTTTCAQRGLSEKIRNARQIWWFVIIFPIEWLQFGAFPWYQTHPKGLSPLSAPFTVAASEAHWRPLWPGWWRELALAPWVLCLRANEQGLVPRGCEPSRNMT